MAPMQASNEVKLPSQEDVFHQLQELKKDRKNVDRLTEDEVIIRDHLLCQLYVERDLNHFYSQDDEEFPIEKISTVINGQKFFCVLARTSIMDKDRWAKVPGKNGYYRGFYWGTWPATCIDHLVGEPDLSKEPCVACAAPVNVACQCDYMSWVDTMQSFWVISTMIKPVPRGGHGLFARDDIPKDTILGEYTGELQVDDKTVSDEASSYFARIPMGEPRSKHTTNAGGQSNCEIDGSRTGSPFRFSNHSCNPNAAMFVGRVGMMRRLKYLMCLRTIKAGEEITADYGKGWFKKEPCWCESEYCRNPLDVGAPGEASRPTK
jgi:hypothetical protein